MSDYQGSRPTMVVRRRGFQSLLILIGVLVIASSAWVTLKSKIALSTLRIQTMSAMSDFELEVERDHGIEIESDAWQDRLADFERNYGLAVLWSCNAILIGVLVMAPWLLSRDPE